VLQPGLRARYSLPGGIVPFFRLQDLLAVRRTGSARRVSRDGFL